MDTNFDARDALSAADDARRAMADRLFTPWWYHSTLGALVFLGCLAIGLPRSAMGASLQLGIYALVAVGAATLIAAYRRITGVAISGPAGRQSTHMLWITAAGTLLPLLACAAIGLSHGPWWAIVAMAALAAVLTVVLGRRYDDALRADLRAGGQA